MSNIKKKHTEEEKIVRRGWIKDSLTEREREKERERDRDRDRGREIKQDIHTYRQREMKREIEGVI